MVETDTDFHNPTDVAVRVMKLEGAFALLQQQTSSSINNMSSATQSLQAEIRAMHHKFDALPKIQMEQVSLQQSIDRAFQAIDRLAGATDDTKTRVVRWSGGAAVLAILASLVVAIGMWYEDRLTQVEARERTTQSLMVVENSQRIREVELAIARRNRETEK